MEPLVSVIIPAHNGALWLAECLDSVLGQSYPRIEVLAINDGSRDATPEILARYQPRIQVTHQRQGGIGAARNRGLEQVRGELVAFIDQDDRWRSDKLELQVRHADRHPDEVVIYSDAEEFDEQGTIHRSFFDLFPSLRQPERIFESIIRLAVPLMSTTLVRREFLLRHRLTFLEAASGVDDVGLFLEIADRGGRFSLIDAALAYRRLHGGNLSKSHYNRFSKRVRLFQALDQTIQQPAHRQLLREGLRGAHFGVGEWHWGNQEFESAREHLAQVRGLDRLGLRAAGLGLASQLPRPLVHWLQKTKRTLVG